MERILVHITGSSDTPVIPGHQPLLPGDTFRIRSTGNQHTAGDIDCIGCGVIDGIRYPTPHRDKTIIHLDFLVHGEAFQDAFERDCEGGCFVPPIKFAPKLPKKT
jgi:hypothetical protein